MGKRVVRLTESDLVRIVERVVNEQVAPKKDNPAEVINACRRKHQMQPPKSCLELFAKIDKGQTPSYEEVKRCAADIVMEEGAAGLAFVNCIMGAFGDNPPVKY